MSTWSRMKNLLKSVAIAVALCAPFIAVMSGVSADTRREVWTPPEQWVRYMVENMKNEELHSVYQTHPPIVYLFTEDTNVDSEGFATYFFFRGGQIRWQISLRQWRADGSGFVIDVWEFVLDHTDKVIYYQTNTGVDRGDGRPITILTHDSLEWARAMDFSRHAWKMLCEKFPCGPVA